MADVRIAIVGAGFSGLGMAIRLKQEGIEDFVVLERADDVGGVWRDNTYPGCECDVPSHLYSYSFDLSAEWQDAFSRQPQILGYLRSCVERHGLRPHLRLGTELLRGAWDEGAREWRLHTQDAELTADILITAAGPFSAPITPVLPGLERFEGTTFHSSSWDHDHDLAADRVAVVGTGASGVQLVPEVQRRAAALQLYQRSAPWVFPKGQRPISAWERRLYRRFPPARRLARSAIYLSRELIMFALLHRWVMWWVEGVSKAYLALSVRDRDLRRRLRPGYRMGCKRMVLSNEYYRALTQPNAELVTSPIAEVRERSIVCADGSEREVDTIVFATGFHVTDPPILGRLRGRDGEPLVPAQRPLGRIGLRGTTVSGLPNLFMLIGPNTGVAHTSLIYMAESQYAYVLDCLRTLRESGAETMEARPEAEEAYNRSVQERLRGSVWETGCTSYYQDVHGRNTALWPGHTFRFREQTRHVDPGEYELAEA